MKIKTCIISLLLAVGCLTANAQDKSPLDFTFQVKNMHLWRGIEVTSTALGAVDLNVSTKDQLLTFGIWGGAGFEGTYREFDYYVRLQKAGFSIEAWDIYNFSKDAQHENDKLFNYNTHTSGHFIDLTAAYQLQGNFPLKVSWSTVVFGRDRGTTLSGKTKQRYSTYVAVDCPVLRHKIVNLDFTIAGAFALDKAGDNNKNFYGNTDGIVNLSLTASKVLKIGSYKLPVAVTSMWNPQMDRGNIQIAFNLF